jgi:hypothetical protein
MCSENTVVGRDEKKPSKDGKGFSDEIRSGDRRMMKLPMEFWRPHRKAQLMAAFQLAYPQPFASTGKPMTAKDLVPGLSSEMLDDAGFQEARRAPKQNSVVVQHKEI